jgi:hypothetical protein
VDNFKSYNDTAGHLQGDQCLVRIAQLLGETCRRPRDLAARFGGEEFVILMPGTSHSGAMFYAKGLQRMVHQLALPHPASDGKTCVTLSGGITTCVPDGTTTIESLPARRRGALHRQVAGPRPLLLLRDPGRLQHRPGRAGELRPREEQHRHAVLSPTRASAPAVGDVLAAGFALDTGLIDRQRGAIASLA